MAAAGVGLLAVGGVVFGLSGGGHVDQRETLTHEISALTIDAGAGDVTVRTGAAAGTIEVVRRVPRSLGTLPSADQGWQGSTLALGTGCSGSCDIDYEVRVPDGVAVTAHTGSGDIKLDGALGAVSVEAGSGDVDADVTTTTLATRSGSGDLDLRLRSAPSQLTASSGSGDVDIRLPNAQSYAVDSETGSGDRDVHVQQDGASDHHVQVKTGSGDISVRDS